MLSLLIKQVADLQSLSAEAVSIGVKELVSESVSVSDKADFLCALAKKGETTEEIAVFARELRARAIELPIDEATRACGILDVVGTGGDHLNTFNISTTVAIVAASAGVFVAKHGNRAITSKSGSADVLEALGIKTDLSPEMAARSLREHHFAFLFAPKYHPVFKHIAPARKLCAERGQRTIFNYLGPLLNPVRPDASLVGTPRPELCEPMARVLQMLGVRRAMVVCGSVVDDQETRHFDELSTLGETAIVEFYQEHGLSASTLTTRNFPIQQASLSDLKGGDPQASAAIIRCVLNGAERGPRREAVLLNAAAALFVSGKSKSMTEGWELAEQLIDSGASAAKLESLAQFSRECQ